MLLYDRLEFRHLKFIVAIAEEGSMSRAAERLNVVQSNLSKQINEIEDCYGVRLFKRTYNGMQLTPAGTALYQYAVQMLGLRKEAVSSLHAVLDVDTRPLRLGFSQFVDSSIVQSATSAYHELFPGGTIEVEGDNTDCLTKGVVESRFDGAIITLPFPTNGLCSQALKHERMLVCLRKDDPLAQHTELPPKELDGRLGIFSDSHHHIHAHTRLLEMLNEQGITPRIFSSTLSSEQIQVMVQERMCLALIREQEGLHDSLTMRPIQGVSWTIDTAIVYRSRDAHGGFPLLLRELRSRYPVANGKESRKHTRPSQRDPGLFDQD